MRSNPGFLVILVAILFLVTACQPSSISSEDQDCRSIERLQGNDLCSPRIRVPKEHLTFNQDYGRIAFTVPLGRQVSCTHLRIPSHSMSPFIENNTKVCGFTPESPDDVQEGDIVVYRDINNLSEEVDTIIHRVLDIDGTSFTLDGDNNPRGSTAEDTVPFDAIESVVFAVIW